MNILEHDVTEEEFNDIMSEEEFKKFQEESDKKVIKKLNEKYKLLEEFNARWDLLPLRIIYDIFSHPPVTSDIMSDKNIMVTLEYCLPNIDKDAGGVRKMLSYICCFYINKHFCVKRDAMEMLARYCGRLQELYFNDAKIFSEIYPDANKTTEGGFSYYINKALKSYYEAESYDYASIHEVAFLFYLISAMYYIDTEIKKEG